MLIAFVEQEDIPVSNNPEKNAIHPIAEKKLAFLRFRKKEGAESSSISLFYS